MDTNIYFSWKNLKKVLYINNDYDIGKLVHQFTELN